MEHQKITNLLVTPSNNVPRFITKKWIEVHDQSSHAEDRYKPSKEMRFKTSMLRSDLCDDDREFIEVRNRFLAFKNNASLTNCISKINNVLIDNAEDLDVVMPMYNLLEYNKIIEKQQAVSGIITEMNLIILLPPITMQNP